MLKWFDHEFDEVQLTFSPNYLADNAAHITWIGGHSVLFAAKNEYQYCRIIETDQSSTSSVSFLYWYISNVKYELAQFYFKNTFLDH